MLGTAKSAFGHSNYHMKQGETALSGRIGENIDGPNLRGQLFTASHWLAALLAVVCYLNILPNDFCDDGIPIVEQNPLVYAPGQWLSIWTTDYWHMAKDATPNRDLLYRPLAITTYRAVTALFGESPAPQHAVNILLHALVTIGVVSLARVITIAPAVPLLAGLIFATLPIHSEVIANAVGRADLLAALGTIGALLAYYHVPRTVGPQTHLITYALLPLSVFVALSAKESGVAVLALLPLWHLLSPNRARGPWIIAMLIPALLYFALRYHALEGNLFQKPALTKTVNMLVDAPAWQRGLGALQLWGMYWLKTVWPDILSVNYSVNALRPSTSLVHGHVLLGLAVTFALAATAWHAWRRDARTIVFLIAAIVVSYLPTANLLMLIQVSFAERIWYLPSVFVCVLAAWLLRDVLRPRMAWIIVGCLVAGMSFRTVVRNSEWRDNLTVYGAAYRDAPNAVGALRLFGNELVTAGEYAEGIELLKKAIEIDLGFTDAQRSLGQAYLLVGNAQDAVRHLQIADMQIPGHPPTQAALRAAREALARSGDSTLTALRQQADASPNALAAEIALLRALRDAGQLDEAMQRMRDNASRFDSAADWHYERGVTLVTANRLDEAVSAYERSSELNPSVPSRLVEQAMLRLERRSADDLPRAEKLTADALRQSPGLPEALVCRAELSALRGDLTSAARDYAAAIRALDPSDPRLPYWRERAQTLGGG